MLFQFLIIARLFSPVLELSAAIAPIPDAKHLSASERVSYALYIVEASAATGVDPYLITAVMWHESAFQAQEVSPSRDYGLMQVHWQRLHPEVGEDWLVGLTPAMLLDPRTNILAGARELAHQRAYCRGQRHDPRDHPWWAHHKWGTVVRSPAYGQAILWKRHRLLRPQRMPQQPHRSRERIPAS